MRPHQDKIYSRGNLPRKSLLKTKVFCIKMNQGLLKMHSNSVQNENDKDDNQPVEKNHHPLNFRIVRLKPDYKIFFLQFLLWLYHKLKPSSRYDCPKNIYHRNSKNLWSRTDHAGKMRVKFYTHCASLIILHTIFWNVCILSQFHSF